MRINLVHVNLVILVRDHVTSHYFLKAVSGGLRFIFIFQEGMDWTHTPSMKRQRDWLIFTFLYKIFFDILSEYVTSLMLLKVAIYKIILFTARFNNCASLSTILFLGVIYHFATENNRTKPLNNVQTTDCHWIQIQCIHLFLQYPLKIILLPPASAAEVIESVPSACLHLSSFLKISCDLWQLFEDTFSLKR